MQHTAEQKLMLSPVQQAVLHSVLYYDIFNYPLNAGELYTNSGCKDATVLQVQQAAVELTGYGLLEQQQGYYFLPGKAAVVEYRKQVTERSQQYFSKAERYSALIAKFPFVEAVFITGSLAKGCMPVDGDIDYLIVTRPGRLWVCRAALVAFKKIFLLGSRRYFCVNYYVDSDSLAIPDRNIFTATEVIAALPAYNVGVCKKFFAENNWLQQYYPNRQPIFNTTIHPVSNNPLKRFSEWVLSGWLGEQTDAAFMRLFIWRWKQKFKGTDNTRFEVNFRSRKNVSKHHPQGFQFKVLAAYNERIAAYEKQYGVKLV